jgi:phage terminase small subunit
MHLSPAARDWWLTTAQRWVLEDHHLRLLTLAAQAWDDAQEARAEIRRDGATVTMPSGAVRPHPAIRREHDARLTFGRLLAQLNLEDDGR